MTALAQEWNSRFQSLLRRCSFQTFYEARRVEALGARLSTVEYSMATPQAVLQPEHSEAVTEYAVT